MAAITYALQVDNAPAALVIDAVDEIEVESHLEMASIMRIRFNISLTEDGARWQILDDFLIRRLTSLRLIVSLGIGVPSVVFDGHAVETVLDLSDQPGGSSFTVIALDATALMNLQEKVLPWPNMSDDAIAAAVFAQYGVVPDVAPTQPRRLDVETTVTQRDTDIRFLRHLANRNGFDVYLEPVAPGVVMGHFHGPRVTSPPEGVLSTNFGEATNVVSFTARHDMLRPVMASASGVQAATVAPQPAEAVAGVLPPLGLQPFGAIDRPRRTLLRVAGMSQVPELQTLAQGVVERSTWAVTAEGEVDTAAYGGVLKVGSTVLVRGAGLAFSGAYLVERVLHRIRGERYTQQFTLRRNALVATGAEVYVDDAGLPL